MLHHSNKDVEIFANLINILNLPQKSIQEIEITTILKNI